MTPLAVVTTRVRVRNLGSRVLKVVLPPYFLLLLLLLILLLW